MATYRRRPPRRPVTINGLGQVDTVGAKVWEWLHPEQVRAEYELQMRQPPPDVSFGDVLDVAAENTRAAAVAAGEYGREAFRLAKIAVIGGAVLYALYLATKLTKKR